MTKILVHARGAVRSTMGSTGIRAYHTARVLADQLPDADVTLATPNDPDIPPPHERVRLVDVRNAMVSFQEMLRHDIIISRNFPPHMPALFMSKLLALDFYSTFSIEWLEITKRIPNPARKRAWMSSNVDYIATQLSLADFIVCSNERQRDVLAGALSMLGLIPPEVYNRDPTLRRLVEVAPFGVRPGVPRAGEPVLKGVVPGIKATDKVVIWNGSLMEWFDAVTVIRAMAGVARRRSDVKLDFLGTQHPDFVAGTNTPPVRDAIALAEDLGLLDSTVFFNIDWVPYEHLGRYLAEADVGVCAARPTLEARYAFRTRYVDLYWAGVPIVCTAGDELAARVERDPLGLVVPPGDHDAMAGAILRILDDEELRTRCRCNLELARDEQQWERTLAPLVEFCRRGESIAAPKRKRLLPLLRRTARYVVSHELQQRMPDDV